MKISVIIPTYNVANYISTALDSIINQSEAVEVICLDDNSSDNTLEILNKYAATFHNIKVIANNENYGPGHLRNLGISLASGDFLLFLDADDWYEPLLFKKLYQIISLYPDINIIEFRFNVSENLKSKRLATWLDLGKSGIKKTSINNVLLSTAAWNKCWNKEFLVRNKLSFCESNRSGEEIPLNICSLILSKEFYYLDYVGYNWRYVENSLSHDKNKDEQFLNGVWDMLNSLKNEMLRLNIYDKDVYNRCCATILMWHINEKFSVSKHYVKYYKKVQKFLKQTNQKTLKPFWGFALRKISK